MNNSPFQSKPKKEEVSIYEKELNHFLSAHNANISIELLDFPIRIESYTDGKHDGTEYHWIKSIKVKTPEFEFEIKHLFSEFTPFRQSYFDKKYAWTDALSIQDEMYEKSGKFESLKVGSNDPYWKLWSFITK